MCSLSVKCVTLTHSLYEFIHPLVLILLELKETLGLLSALRSLDQPFPPPSLTAPFFCRSVLILSPWLLFIAGEKRALVAVSVLMRLSVRARVCVWDMFVRARHISLGWWWGICERVWVCVRVAVRMRALRRWQSCAGRVKMMAVVRTSLQKVVVFLHRLQRMAISSPRYQKLCKVSAVCTHPLKRFHPISASLR